VIEQLIGQACRSRKNSRASLGSDLHCNRVERVNPLKVKAIRAPASDPFAWPCQRLKDRELRATKTDFAQ